MLALRYDWRNNSVLFLHNFADEPREIAFSTGVKGTDDLINLLTSEHSKPQRRASIVCVSKPTGTDGTGWAAWTTC